MKTIAASALSLLLVFSCKNKDEDHTSIPDNVLRPDSFTSLLVDYSLSESATNLNILALPLEKADSAYAFDPLAQHHVRKTQYDSTLMFYAAHPILYRMVYDSVLARLDQLKLVRKMAEQQQAAGK